jgi:SAM-dependent methyltransferase
MNMRSQEFDAVSADIQLSCAKYLKWHIDRCTISESGIAISGWALRYPFAQEYNFLANGEPFKLIDWPIESPHIAEVFGYVPYSEKSSFFCRHPLTDANRLYPNKFVRFDFVTDQGRHPLSYRHAWFQADPENAPKIPEAERVKRVIGVADLESYLRGGATIACRLSEYLLQSQFCQPLSRCRSILDWGCGCARVTRHLITLTHPNSVTGVDIDADNIAWCRENIVGARFEVTPPLPPTHFSDAQFDLVIGISVFTHLSEHRQNKWLQELQRVTCKGAILLMSIHGPSQLAMQSQQHVYKKALECGIYDVGYNVDLKGFANDREAYRDVVRSRDYVYSKFSQFFDVIDIVDAIAGNQDLIVLRRR